MSLSPLRDVIGDAACDGTSQLVLLVNQHPAIIVIGDKAHLDEDGRHMGGVKDDEAWTLLDSSVHRTQAAYDLALDPAGQRICRAPPAVDKRLSALGCRSSRVAVQADKNICRPCVGAEAYVGIGRILTGKVVALHGLDLTAGGRQITGCKIADVTGNVSLGHSIVTVDSAGVDARMMSGV